jgi:surface protein
VSNVTVMYRMFLSSEFNQDLSTWNVDQVTDCFEFDHDNPQWTLPKPNFTNCIP